MAAARPLTADHLPADDVGAQLADWGKVAWIQTRGRSTGRPVAVAVGFVEDADGSILIAAGEPDADWARNLDADPHVRVRIEERAIDAVAESLGGAATATLVVDLILKYGTPAERLGRGPAYRLRPINPPGGR